MSASESADTRAIIAAAAQCTWHDEGRAVRGPAGGRDKVHRPQRRAARARVKISASAHTRPSLGSSRRALPASPSLQALRPFENSKKNQGVYKVDNLPK
jgi:hypothetical protein